MHLVRFLPKSFHSRTVTLGSGSESDLEGSEDTQGCQPKCVSCALWLATHLTIDAWLDVPVFQGKAPIELARRFYAAFIDLGFDPKSVDPYDLLPFADFLAESLGDFDDLVADTFLRYFPRVRLPFGQDILSFSMNEARALQLPALPSNLRPKHRLLANLAFLLQTHVGDNPISLPHARIANWLNISRRHVASIITILSDRGLLSCTDPTFSFKEHRAKKYRFSLPTNPPQK